MECIGYTYCVFGTGVPRQKNSPPSWKNIPLNLCCAPLVQGPDTFCLRLLESCATSNDIQEECTQAWRSGAVHTAILKNGLCFSHDRLCRKLRRAPKQPPTRPHKSEQSLCENPWPATNRAISPQQVHPMAKAGLIKEDLVPAPWAYSLRNWS